eukprot:gene10686-3307_t
MKLVALTICLLFLAAYGKYSSVHISNHRNCTEPNTGYFVPDSICILNPRTESHLKHTCGSNEVIVETQCSQNCESCRETKKYPLNTCLQVGSVGIQYSCNEKKPTIQSSGFYRAIHKEPFCRDQPLTEFVSKGYCENFKNQKSQSRDVYYDRASNWITEAYYSRKNCAGQTNGIVARERPNECLLVSYGRVRFSSE